MKQSLVGLLILVSGVSIAQSKEQYDAAYYRAPMGWKKETSEFAISFVATNNRTGGWCRITLYKSLKSSGDPKNDFTSEWNNIVVRNNKPLTNPEPESQITDGWTTMSAASIFMFDNKEARVLLSTISGYGIEVSIQVLTNNQEYMNDVESFLNSIELSKPAIVQHTDIIPQDNSVGSIQISSEKGNHGISLSTTNFDDGWVAQPFTEYVRVTKDNTTVLLHYGIEITDEMRNTGNIEGVLFDRLMQPRYQVSNLRKYDNGGPCYFCVYFYEADVVEKATGKKYHAGFRVITNNGVSKCIEIISPSQAEYLRLFPDQKIVENMLNYNKFAVTLSDLAGTWDESTGSYVNMYNTVTGSYAGMNTSSSANKFVFNADGTYFSNHKGAFGMVGSMQFYDQKYNGSLTVTNWDITVTKRFNGKTDVFWAQFEAVRGGKVLHLSDKDAVSMQYHLVKSK